MSASLALKTFANPVEIRTERTLLRQWKDSDLPAWIAMNADPDVRRYFPSIQTAETATADAARFSAPIAERGWGAWALEIPGEASFAGFVGLVVQTYAAHFTPAVEIGWQLSHAHWGKGYATEAAKAALNFAFAQLELSEVVSSTVTANMPSRAVMERIGLRYNAADDFDHPRVVDGTPFKRHVLYRISREAYSEAMPFTALHIARSSASV
jgi:RimJ/RimL family protein N-acetyltransferase